MHHIVVGVNVNPAVFVERVQVWLLHYEKHNTDFYFYSTHILPKALHTGAAVYCNCNYSLKETNEAAPLSALALRNISQKPKVTRWLKHTYYTPRPRTELLCNIDMT